MHASSLRHEHRATGSASADSFLEEDPPSRPSVPLEEHARRITAAWRKSIESIVEAGRLLLAAQDDYPEGDWCQMFKQTRADRQELVATFGREDAAPLIGAVPVPLPFGLATAERLMAIARHPVLADSATWRNLPVSWRALSELANISSERLSSLVTQGYVNPTLTVRDATRLSQIERRASLLPSKLSTVRGAGPGTANLSILERIVGRAAQGRQRWSLQRAAERIRARFVETMLATPDSQHAAVRALWHEVAGAAEVEVGGAVYSWAEPLAAAETPPSDQPSIPSP